MRLEANEVEVLTVMSAAPTLNTDGVSLKAFGTQTPSRKHLLKLKNTGSGTSIITVYLYDNADWGVAGDAGNNGQLQQGAPLDVALNASGVWYFLLTNLGAAKRVAITHTADTGAPVWTATLTDTIEPHIP